MFTFSKKIATKINSMSQVECPQQKNNNNKIPPAQMITRDKKLNLTVDIIPVITLLF